MPRIAGIAALLMLSVLQFDETIAEVGYLGTSDKSLPELDTLQIKSTQKIPNGRRTAERRTFLSQVPQSLYAGEARSLSDHNSSPRKLFKKKETPTEQMNISGKLPVQERGSAFGLNCIGRNGKIFKPSVGFCAYGVTYLENDFFEMVYNDEEGWRFQQNVEQFCSGLSAVNETRFGATVIELMSVGKLVDVFFACCRDCKKLKLVKEEIHLRLQLKNLFIAQYKFNRVRIVLRKRNKRTRKPKFWSYEVLELNKRAQRALNATHPFVKCLSDEQNNVASHFNNFVCFVKRTIENPSVWGRTGKFEETHVTHDTSGVVRRGAYNAASKMDKMRCNTSNTMTAKQWCYSEVLPTTIEFQCCSYGSDAIRFQQMISRENTASTYNGQLKVKRGVSCYFSVTNDDQLQNKSMETVLEAFQKKKIEYQGRGNLLDSSKLAEMLETEKFCESHLLRHRKGEKKIFAFFGKRSYYDAKFNLSALRASFPSCEEHFVEDYRLDDIYRRRCFVTVPNNEFCPFNNLDGSFDTDLNKDQRVIMCCCNDGMFCNYDPDLRTLREYAPPHNCYYNNDYQHLFNKFAITSPKNRSRLYHSCLLHYIGKKVREDIILERDYNLKRSFNGILNVLPGANLLPIDFDYVSLKDGECGYIESKVNYRYLTTRNCDSTTILETEFLPLKLFVCRCFTNLTKNARHCDRSVQEDRISEKEDSFMPNDKSKHCTEYEDQTLTDIFKKNGTYENRYNNISSVCYTRVIALKDALSKTLTVDAGFATRPIVNRFAMHLDHIAWALLTLTDEPLAPCASMENRTHIESYCFCRGYGDVREPCNNIGMATAAIETTTSQMMISGERRHYFVELDAKAETGSRVNCAQDGSMAVISKKEYEYDVQTNCIYDFDVERHQRKLEQALCERGVMKESCALIEKKVLCCAKSEPNHVLRNIATITKNPEADKKEETNTAAAASGSSLITISLVVPLLLSQQVAPSIRIFYI